MSAYIVERNGLGVKRHAWGTKGAAYWSIEHVPTGLRISGKIGYDHKGRWKFKEVKAAFIALADAFPWKDWTVCENPPAWADDAYKAIKEQETPLPSHFTTPGDY